MSSTANIKSANKAERDGGFGARGDVSSSPLINSLHQHFVQYDKHIVDKNKINEQENGFVGLDVPPGKI